MPGKGLGVVALRPIPALSRIMVDTAYTFEEASTHPAAAALEPISGSFTDKVSNFLS